MPNKTYAHALNVFALTAACLALTGIACTKSDSLGRASEKDGGTDTIGKDDTIGRDLAPLDRHDSAPDTAGEDGTVGADDGYDAGTYLCQANADGTCSAVTPNTSCLPLRGVLYDQSANCVSTAAITLYCGAWQTNTMGGFAAMEGCLQIPKDGGTSIYRTFESDIGNPQWRSWTCDSTLNMDVSEATECGANPTDGSPPFGDTAPDGSACAIGYHPYYTAPGCGTNAVPVCLSGGDAALAIAQFCACDGVTTVTDDARGTISPYLYAGACKKDGGPSAPDVPPTDAPPACATGTLLHYAAPGCGANAVPTCIAAPDASVWPMALYCLCDGVTTMSYETRLVRSPYLYAGACKQDGGTDTVPAKTDGGDPCVACTASQVCVQSFDGTCKTNGVTCKSISDACKTKLSASGAKSCASFSECQSELCTSPYQCLINTPCGSEAPQAAIYCYGP